MLMSQANYAELMTTEVMSKITKHQNSFSVCTCMNFTFLKPEYFPKIIC